MNRQQYAEMLKHINQVRVERGDTSACIAEYVKRYKFVYVYNDSIFKKIFGNPENEKMSCAFLNAILKLDGPDCITKLSFVDPSVPGGPFVKTITSDLVAKDQRADRIVIEVQHQYDSTYKDRLVFYTAIRQVLFCKFMHKKQIFPSPYRLSKLYLPSIPRAVPSAENQRAVRRIPGWGKHPRPSSFS